MIDNSKNPKLKEVYTTKDGTKFYSFENPLDISALRGLASDKAKRYMALNITERSLKALLTEIRTAAGQNDLMKAFSIIQDIDFRLRFLAEENSVLDLACIYFFLVDEDPDEPSETFNRKKHKIFETDLKAKAFFLRIGLSLADKYSEQQEKDTLSYLEEPETKILSERILRYISIESELNSISGLTDLSTTPATEK